MPCVIGFQCVLKLSRCLEPVHIGTIAPLFEVEKITVKATARTAIEASANKTDVVENKLSVFDF